LGLAAPPKRGCIAEKRTYMQNVLSSYFRFSFPSVCQAKDYLTTENYTLIKIKCQILYLTFLKV
jgi:hypothetical protein